MLARWIDLMSGWLKGLSAASLAAMMLMTCADVIGRTIKMPIIGAVEITALLATLTLAFSLPYAHRQHAHVGVELLTMRMSEYSQAWLRLFTGALSFGLFAIIAWQCADYATQMRASGEVSLTLELPYYLVIYFVGASFAVLSLVQLIEWVGDVLFVFTKRGSDT